jgi:ParB-like chromosome segregation protein Spo0J
MKVRDLPGVNRIGDLQTIDPDLVVICSEGPLADDESRKEIPEEMIRNVMFYGVIEPIVVRRNGEKLEVVDGRRRV